METWSRKQRIKERTLEYVFKLHDSGPDSKLQWDLKVKSLGLPGPSFPQ